MDWLRQVPIGQYVAGNASWLRKLDPRLKLGWVLMFLLTPVLAGSLWRIALVSGLVFITFISWLPRRIWWRPFFLLLILSSLVGLLALFLPTGDPPAVFAVRSPDEVPSVKLVSKTWELLRIGPLFLGPIELGPLIVNRRSAELGLNTSTLIFTLVHSVNLMLITTPPEDLVWSVRWFMAPLDLFGLPVDRICFQLLLSLRFLPLVQEELQNLGRSLAIRAVNLRKLGFKASIGLILSVGERLLANILLRSEQGADALMARGGFPLHPSHMKPATTKSTPLILLNISSGVFLVLIFSLRWKYGSF